MRACCILYYLANLFFFPLEMLKILPFELVNNHFSVRNYFFFLYKMSYYVHAHQTFEDQYPSPTKYLPLKYLLERHLEILKCKFMCV